MTLERRGEALVITWLPVEQMGLITLGLAFTPEEGEVLAALLRGEPVYLEDGALEYKQFRRTAEQGVYVKFTGLERELREMGIRRLRAGGTPGGRKRP